MITPNEKVIMEAEFFEKLIAKGTEDEPTVRHADQVVSLSLDNTAMFSEMWEEKNEFCIPIWKEFKKCLPFGALQSRHVTAIMLSYFGSNDWVYELMRCTSHKTRAYIKNAKGLKGFLVPFSVSSVLRTLAQNRNGELTRAL